MMDMTTLTALMDLGKGNDDHYMYKFTQRPGQWLGAARRIADQQAENLSGRHSILDIGCGFPYFVTACRERGHEVIGLDVYDRLISAAAAILDIPFVGLTIKAHEALPRVLSGYDLVSMFGVNLRHGDASTSNDYWDVEEYRFLAADIRTRLNPHGAWYLRPNTERHQHFVSARWWRQVAGPDAFIYIGGAREVWVEWPKS